MPGSIPGSPTIPHNGSPVLPDAKLDRVLGAEGWGAMRFSANLGFLWTDHACKRAAAHGITILIEPLNSRDVPGFFLSGTDQAAAL